MKHKLILTLLSIQLFLLSCKKEDHDQKYCTKVIDNYFTSRPGGEWVLVINDKMGNKMEIQCTQTDYNTYPVGSTVCLDKDYKIYRG